MTMHFSCTIQEQTKVTIQKIKLKKMETKNEITKFEYLNKNRFIFIFNY